MSAFSLKTEDSTPAVRLSATVERRVEPDTAEVTVMFEGTFPTREECASDHNAQVAKMKLALAPFCLEGSLKSDGYACTQNRTRKNALKGFSYIERASLVLPRKGTDVGAILDALEGCGTTASFVVRYYHADESAIEEELAAAAVARSRQTAEKLAAAAGAKVAGVKSISYRSYTPACLEMAPGDSGVQDDLDPTPVEVEATVEVEWRLEEPGE